jgi:energy-coupling factor transporter transmembrane protein EcfT
MRKIFFKKYGIFLILMGSLFILNSLSGITGFIIAKSIGKNISSIFGFVLVVGGILVLMSIRIIKEGNLAKQILTNGEIILNPKKLKKIAKQIEREKGYYGRKVKEGYQVLDKNRIPLTVIPKHNISKGVYYSIIKSLATGIPSFRKRTDYSLD